MGKKLGSPDEKGRKLGYLQLYTPVDHRVADILQDPLGEDLLLEEDQDHPLADLLV